MNHSNHISYNNSPYDTIAQHYDQMFAVWGKNYEEESLKLLELIEKYKWSEGNKLLDIACGTGEHIKYLKEYYSPTGIDISSSMLDICKRKLPKNDFLICDMMTFELGAKFDVIICMFSAISYARTASNLLRVLNKCVHHLEIGGIVILEPWFAPDEISRVTSTAQFGETTNFQACRMRTASVNNNVAQIKSHVLINNDECIHNFVVNHEIGLLTDSIIEASLRRCGLEIFAEHGYLNNCSHNFPEISRIYIGRNPKQTSKFR